MFRIWVPDLDSPSYFVSVAAVELGLFNQEGIDVEFVYNTLQGPELMRDGKLDFIGGPAFVATRTFPGWKGVKLLCALSQYSYWFLAVRSTLDVKRGDIAALKGLRISAAPPWPEMSLRYMLTDAGIDLERDKIRIVPPPPPYGDKGFMARNGVDSIIQNMADAYWGNGMRVALGESLGIAKLHLDLRRGDGPPGHVTTTFRHSRRAKTSLRSIPKWPRAQYGRSSRRRRLCRQIHRSQPKSAENSSRLMRRS
jgi:NitT/TauT family transport system substrate-binding protein